MTGKAKVVTDNSSTVDMSKEAIQVDLAGVTDEELEALGIDPSTVEREDTEEEDSEEEAEDEVEEEESSDDDSNEDEVEDEDEDDDEPSEDSSEEHQIPKSRFDEAVHKEREARDAAEARSAFLEEQVNKLLEMQTKAPEKPEAPKVDVEALEEEYLEKALAGDTTEALAIRHKINAENQRHLDELIKAAKKEARTEANALSEQEKFDLVIADATNKHTKLNQRSEDYDQELVESINAMAAGLQSTKKMTASKALEKAIKVLLPSQPKPKKETRRRKEKASKVSRTPTKAKSSKVRDVDPGEIDWANMTEAQFDKMKEKHSDLINKQLGLS